MFYLKWIPLVVSYYVFYGWLSVLLNKTKSPTGIVLLSLLGAIPIWPIVAAYSKRVAVDALIYDFFMIVCCTLAVIYFSGARFSVWQWIGVALSVAGLTLVMRG